MLHISRYSSIFDSAITPDSGLEDVSNVIIKLIPGIIFPAMYLDIFLEALREYCVIHHAKMFPVNKLSRYRIK